MECGRARQLLWPPDRPRIASPAILEARRHVDACPSCRVHFAVDDVLGDVRARLRLTVPPEQVRARVLDATADNGADPDDRTPGRAFNLASPALRPVLIALAVLTAAGAAGAVAIAYVSAPPAARTADPFLDDYMRLAVREEHIVSDDPAEVRRFLLRELGRPLVPISSPGLHITGAEVCLLDGRRGAVIRYRTAYGILTYYLLPAPNTVDAKPAVRETGSGSSAALVTWARDDVEHALVGPLPAEILLEIALRAG